MYYSWTGKKKKINKIRRRIGFYDCLFQQVIVFWKKKNVILNICFLIIFEFKMFLTIKYFQLARQNWHTQLYTEKYQKWIKSRV